jgi:hypothetical protein
MYIEIIIALVSAFVVAILVGYVSRRVLTKQQVLAERIEATAGIERIKRIHEQTPFSSFAEIVRENYPQVRLRILAVSGGSLFQGRDDLLVHFLSKGIRIQMLLMDPHSEVPLYGQNQWLLTETKATLNRLNKIIKESPRASTNLEVRLYNQQPLAMLLFIDDKLFLSSYLPVSGRSRIIYEIRQGEQSLYTIFDESFKFIWEAAIPSG